MRTTKRGILFGVFLVSLILTISVVVLAKPDFVSIENPSGNSFEIPYHAVQVSEGVFSLGAARDVDGRLVEGFMFIDNRRGNAKPGTECGNGICEPGENARKCPADCGSGNGEPPTTSSCFSLFAKGAKWKTTEPYITDGVDTTLTETSLETWDSEVGFDIFGTRDASGVVDGSDKVAPDGKNEVMFENLGATNTIAYAIVWGRFGGPPKDRELIEWDVVFNSDYAFGDAGPTDENNVGDTGVMDYQNIATHEFGHALGLGHPDGCTEETMYAYAEFGETKKRTLEAGDTAGVNKLY